MKNYKMGLDIGSTTVKAAILDENGNQIYSAYRRHLSDVKGGLFQLFSEMETELKNISVSLNITGSAGMSAAAWMGLPFVQEVVAGTEAVNRYIPEADVVIELGGEDAKITFMKPVLSQRMNGTCAGGTGAFIDQMASLLQIDTSELNELAKKSTTIYSIASRCGVFAKSDMQPLFNEGAPKEDLAASVLQAVVNQTIAGLACGQTISGNVVFLGGPLHYLSELRKAFEKTLKDTADRFISPEDGHLFVALGAALLAKGKPVEIHTLTERLKNAAAGEQDIPRMRPLFLNDEEKEMFLNRHAQSHAVKSPIESQKGPCYLGIDAGSTTIKAVLINHKKEILYTYYSSNQGNPVYAAINILKEVYGKLPKDAYIGNVCATGYGEALIKASLRVDEGEIETMSHFKAAKFFNPDVDFIIDIGGQDMKCMRIKNGIIDSIILNEACSSGCGSFIQTFAKSLGMEPWQLAEEALKAENPVDLGTRCTVFMNSRVKQAQKEGASVGDISAGLSYSVIRNALYKVIKLKSPEDMGKNILVQGGTFYNNAILRCFELMSGREVIRPDISGLMGAFGSAILALERDNGKPSAILSADEIDNSFHMETKQKNCELCPNHCKLTISCFDGGRSLISGNRCERGSGNPIKTDQVPNLVDYKYKRLFSYKPLAKENAYRGTIGIPRVLNFYENYPFWFTYFTELGFRVVLSKRSDHTLFEKGMSTIPSESVCYPAKLVHGHIIDLIEKDVQAIFMPCMPYEHKENQESNNHYNCPIVTSYAEVVENNIELLRTKGILFKKPFLSLEYPKKAAKTLAETFREYHVTEEESERAFKHAAEEQEKFKKDMAQKGRETVRFLEETGMRGIVLAGRPYHVDHEINHGIPQMITSLGLAVLTEDSVSQLGKAKRPIRVVDQWVYHSRLYDAAAFVCSHPLLELVQLNSFGCGLDAVTTDQVQEILERNHQIYTLLKIDEINNLGAARIRMRSLKVALDERGEKKNASDNGDYVLHRKIFTKKMRKEHTIIAPQMSPIHFELVEPLIRKYGYHIDVLRSASAEDIEVGLRYVNNDACYPTIIVVGQLLNALLSGKYDPNHTSVLITQTGGGCRATNYIALLRKALKDAHFEHVPVISLNLAGMEKNPGFQPQKRLMLNAVKALCLGDVMMNVLYRVRPYEKEPGAANALYEKWNRKCIDFLCGKSRMSYRKLVNRMVAEFDRLPIHEALVKPRVGVVGEILVKFHPDANNDVVNVIENEGCEAIVPGLIDFFLYFMYSSGFKHDALGLPFKHKMISALGIRLIERYRDISRKALAKSDRFDAPPKIESLAQKASEILSIGNCCGEGWLLTAEMIELIEMGAPNIICAQPFACLPNHVTGKGMIKELRRLYPDSNIMPIDYDPGASEVNQINRIKLMLSSAFKRLEGEKRKIKTEAQEQQETLFVEENAVINVQE